MPLDSPEAYERLGEHLCAVDPILEEFCRETGFARRTTGISRYPMRRLDLHREVSWFIELRMDEDERGERYDTFFPDIPYTLSGGAWLPGCALPELQGKDLRTENFFLKLGGRTFFRASTGTAGDYGTSRAARGWA